MTLGLTAQEKWIDIREPPRKYVASDMTAADAADIAVAEVYVDAAVAEV